MDPLLAILVVLVLLWFGGFTMGVGGGLIHWLLAVVLVLGVVKLLQSQK